MKSADMFLHTLLTPKAQETQRHYRARTYGVPKEAPLPDELTDGEREFLESRNSFYLSCTTEDGWPYNWNCSKFIPPLVAPAELSAILNPLKARIAELEAQLDATRSS